MAPRKKSTSNTESSSTSSDSDSNSSSSSSSESGSDSESSSSDSGSSSSASVPKDTKPENKNVRRRSQDSASNTKVQQQQQRTEPRPDPVPQQKVKDKPSSATVTKEMKLTNKRSSSVSSADDSETYSKNSSTKNKTTPPAAAKNKPSVKSGPPPKVTGGKVPPSVIKQQQQMAQQSSTNGSLKPSAGMKAAGKIKNKNLRYPNIKVFFSFKAQQKHSAQSNRKSSSKDAKKKTGGVQSANSSESEDSKPQKKERRASINTSTTKPPKPANPNQPQQQVSRGRGRPRKNPLPPQKVPQSKAIIPSSSTSSTDSSSTDSEDSQSSISSLNNINNKTVQEKTPVKQKIVNNTNDTNNSSSTKQDPAKKFTRSSSTRKSRHLLGKYTDTDDSDSTSKSISKSPAKNKSAAFYLAKFNSKKSIEMKPILPASHVMKQEPEEKRTCPFEECDSIGHLGGVEDTHFTVEACPKYHNMTVADTKNLLLERKKRDEERKKAIEMFDRARKMITPEQKLYQQKVREARSKFKSPTNVKDVEINDDDRDKEPNIKGFVPDYDYQLFRQAQCAASENIENELKLLPASKGTKYITMGKHCMQVWYQSPYPEDVARLPKLYLCEFCLRYQKCAIGMKRHAAKCVWRHPPGDEIYRKGKLGVWQIDGKRQKQYCQFLCLLAKFFLDHKTLYYDVEPFLFYVMTIADADGCHTIGYFSKEKNSFLNYNVSCILTLPPYQRKGYGRLLIDFSYLLTRVEGKIGSPEKPLSDLGLISYRSYWKDVLLNYLCSRKGNTLNIKDISQEMAINSYDIVSTLQALGMMKYWKGKHIILKKQDVLEEYQESLQHRDNFPKIDPSCLKWIPWIQHSTPS
uniref:Histone acetyltransferase n=1 Tax=Culicoides sonorensis TaxID=179676 RepID=A0A336M0C9_CULSO